MTEETGAAVDTAPPGEGTPAEKPVAKAQAALLVPPTSKAMVPPTTKAPATVKAPAPKAPKVVDGCYSVVSKIVRSGKGKGRGVASAAGGFVPIHLRGPQEDVEAEDAVRKVPEDETVGEDGAIAAEVDAATADAAEPAAADASVAADSTIAEESALDGTGQQIPEGQDAAAGGSALSGGNSFDSTTAGGLSAGSFDAEITDSGASVRKRAKRWQKRGSASANDVTKASSTGELATGEPAEKRLKEAPSDGGATQATECGGGPSMDSFPPSSPGVFPPASPAPDPLPPATPMPEGPATLAKLPISRLKSLARYHGVSIAGCLEKAEMVAALKKAGLDDEHAEKEAERARNASGEAQPKSEQQKEREEIDRKAAELAAKRAAAKLSEVENRASAAERENQRLREALDASKSSTKKKWSPAFQSTPFIPGMDEQRPKDSGFPPRSPVAKWGAAGVRPPQAGMDMRFNGGKGACGGCCGGGKGGFMR